MDRDFFIFEDAAKNAVIRVVGVGGGGGNAINNMIEKGISNVDFIAANTDAQALSKSNCPTKIHLGSKLTKGLGAGGNPEVGRKAAIEAIDQIEEALEGSDLVFITCGLGGGTGTGAAPIVASVAKDIGALTVAVVTMPFSWEGKRRSTYAEEGLKFLKDRVDSYIVVPNDRIIPVIEKETTFAEALSLADDVLGQGVQGVSDSINNDGHINVDFNDVKTIMGSKGKALMGIGVGSGDNRAGDAVRAALSSPLLCDIDIRGAYGLLLYISGGDDMTMMEVNDISTSIHDIIGDNAFIIMGAGTDHNLNGKIKVTIVSTGLSDEVKNSSKMIDITGKVRGGGSGANINMNPNATTPQTITREHLPTIEDFKSQESDYEIPSILRNNDRRIGNS